MINKAAAFTLLALSLFGCHNEKKEEATGAAKTESAVAETPLAEVRSLVQAHSATVVDANDGDTRKEYGVVPGAVLLSSSKDYALSELPADKATRLVFYCGGVKCRASDNAAKRAADNGYTRVSVMREGIRGWKDSGAPTQPASQS